VGGKTYTLLTSSQTLPSDIASKVIVDQHNWIVETVDGGKTLQIYRKVGTTHQRPYETDGGHLTKDLFAQNSVGAADSYPPVCGHAEGFFYGVFLSLPQA
jgi:hypothetical protein